MKQHLAGEKGNVASCKNVPPEIRFMIQGSLKENVEKAKEKRGSLGIDEYAFGASAHEFSYDDYTAYAKNESHKQQPESSKKKAKTRLEHSSKSKDMAKQVKQVVLDERFWNSCNIIVRVGTPLVRLLRICDSDEKPSLGVKYSKRPYDPVDYECIDKSEFWIVEETQKVNLIMMRWKNCLRKMPRYDEESSFDPKADLEQFGRQSRSTYYSDNENEDNWD
ncbi:UNVERIFIED_CONTAM: hypothetical protein Scaly_0050000 [Sesamum calycinum]|uniref:Uncharacterized protein n=1 Tax=Sesamum calycinum TaxID=2727403 RepID=A0AAW2SWS7_9LAMI